MVETLSKRRTHYEVLGLAPTATNEEIEQAFVREFGCFRTHTVGELADGTVAYETLRNPARRRSYDASLRPEPEAPPRQPPVTWRIGAQVMTATATPATRPMIEPRAIGRPVDEPRVVEPQMAPEPQSREEPAIPFIAATLDELASKEPLAKRLEARGRPQADPARSSEAEPNGAPRAEEESRVHLALNDFRGNTEEGSIPWRQAGVVVGAVAAAVALLGAWAGWESVSGAEPVENATKAALPPPTTTYTVSDPAIAVPDRVLDKVPPASVRRPAHAQSRAVPARPTSRIADLERGLAVPGPVSVDVATAAIAPAEASPAVAANLPLSNRMIARTIERIGYPCGQIASTTQSDAPGVFKVTCTSGHSYQAAPVRGRYHFRRLARG